MSMKPKDQTENILGNTVGPYFFPKSVSTKILVRTFSLPLFGE